MFLSFSVNPSQGIDRQAEVVTSQPFQQMLRRSAGSCRVSSQFRAIADDAGRIRRSEAGPQLRQVHPFADVPLLIPGMAVQFAIQGEP